MNLNLKKPCANCPFLKEGAIELRPGRIEGIIMDHITNDNESFLCHKTVHGKNGGEWEEDDEGDDQYIESGKESLCMGSVIYMMKIKNPTQKMRIALRIGLLDEAEIEKMYNIVKDDVPQFDHFDDED